MRQPWSITPIPGLPLLTRVTPHGSIGEMPVLSLTPTNIGSLCCLGGLVGLAIFFLFGIKKDYNRWFSVFVISCLLIILGCLLT
jgi:hypothetical protein